MHAILLALVLAHRPVRVEPFPVEPRESLSIVAGCDAFQQPHVVITNISDEPLFVEWLAAASAPGCPSDIWTGADVLVPGQFEGWLTAGSHLLVTVQFSDHTRTVEASCP
jgi:hypothetical protein